MNFSRTPALVGLVAVTAMGLAACGTDNNVSSASDGAGASSANAAAVDCSGAENLSGAGSSAQKNAMDQFTTAYIAACQSQGKSVNVAYTASGSGDGRTQFVAGQVDFAGSDSAIKGDQLTAANERCDAGETWNLPLVFGPVAIAYNLDGVEGLVLDAPTLAKIFDGTITEWNDPAIAALNAGADLPAEKIGVVYRSDSSGTTDNFQTYLETASQGAWTKGAGSDFSGGVGNGSKGSAGVAQAVGTAPGSITYVEQSFADQSNLQVAKLKTGGSTVELSSDSAAKAIAGATFLEPGTNNLALDLTSIYGTTEDGAYPLVLATYEVVCGTGYDAKTATAIKSFLTVAANQGQTGLAALGYVPLPDAMKTTLLDAVSAISAT